MATNKKPNFLESEEGAEARKALEELVMDIKYNTESSYSANASLYPDHVISFVNKHMEYLRAHPMIDPHQYISNLRLMTRK